MRFYLLTNAVLYAVFAIWCTLAADRTAVSLGYVTRNAAGHSEYLVIYGGLQLGLAAFFWWCARGGENLYAGLVLALGLYVPIVAFRVLTVWKYWPVPSLTLAVGALELGLLAWGLVVFNGGR